MAKKDPELEARYKTMSPHSAAFYKAYRASKNAGKSDVEAIAAGEKAAAETKR